MLVSGAALLTACAAFIAYDLVTFRDALVYNLSMQAQIIGSNSVSALLFNDPHSAESTLSALKAAPNILSAGVFTLDGQPFAAYSSNGDVPALASPPLPVGQVEIHQFAGGEVGLVRLIVFQGKPTGTVYIRSDLQRLHARQKRYVGIAALVLAGSLLAALAGSSIFQRSTAEPIVNLAEIARVVSREKNYSVRATPTRNQDELAVLIEAFNEMLEQIQERDAALRQAHAELEQRVRERTAQLTAANKELEAFSYSVSHDLRAPLRRIDGFSAILVEEYGSKLDATAREYLRRVQEGARGMGRLVDDLLNMGRIGRQELVRKPTELGLLVQGVIQDLQPECEGRQIEWRVGDLLPLECDSGLMKVVFSNLLSNAVKYTRPTKCAAIEVYHHTIHGTPVISVRDNGVGFDQNFVHKLFGVFERLHGPDEFEGTGIGLATVQRIIQKHGGQIWAKGEVGKGATFSFTLSASSQEAGATTAPENVEVRDQSADTASARV